MKLRLPIYVLIFPLTYSAAHADPVEVPEISIKHISTAFANMGQCSARFGIEGLYDTELELALSFRDPKGNVLTEGTIHTHLEASSVGKYVEDFIESEAVCELPENTQVVVTKAIAKTGGQTFDLLKLGKVHTDYFQPYRIETGK